MKKGESVFCYDNFKVMTILFSGISLFLVILNNFDIESYVGIFILPFVFLILSYIILLKKMKLDKVKESYYYLIPALLVLFSYFIVDLPDSNVFLNVLVVPITISVFFNFFTNPEYKLTRTFLSDCLRIIPGNFFSNLNYLKILKKDKKDKKTIDNIVIGCSIGIPIALVLLLLLRNADQYFSAFIEKIFGFLKRILAISNMIPNIFLFFLIFTLLFSVFVNILRNRVTKSEEYVPKSINISIGKIVLTIINSVFLLFIISEISKLTVNFLHLPVEYTYSEYAREGFFQLFFVALINIAIIIYYVYFTKSLNENKHIKFLTMLLISFSILLIINSYYRMFLYIGAYGFTVLRLQVILFLLMELLVFTYMLMKVLMKELRKESMLYFMTLVITYIINLYVCHQDFVDFLNRLFNFNTKI